jgi:hypothetical protein
VVAPVLKSFVSSTYERDKATLLSRGATETVVDTNFRIIYQEGKKPIFIEIKEDGTFVVAKTELLTPGIWKSTKGDKEVRIIKMEEGKVVLQEFVEEKQEVAV